MRVGVPYLGALIMRILLFRGPPFSETPKCDGQGVKNRPAEGKTTTLRSFGHNLKLQRKGPEISGSFRKLGVPYIGVFYNKDPIV